MVVAALIALFIGIGVIVTWQDTTSGSLTVFNDTTFTVALPDCSTAVVYINPDRQMTIPIASNHPSGCAVAKAANGNLLGCVMVARTFSSGSVVRLSDMVPCSVDSGPAMRFHDRSSDQR